MVIIGAMRAGYATLGAVYGSVGVLAIIAAIRGGRAEGLTGALRRLGELTWHQPILLALAAGLVLYAVWRGLDAMLDLAGHGSGFGGLERFGLLMVALMHLALAWYAAQLALLGPGLAAEIRRAVTGGMRALVGDPAGRWVVLLVGAGVASFGGFSVWQGATGRYRRHMRPTALLGRLVPLLSFGLIARGIVFAIMGGFIAWAGWTLDPGALRGIGDALEEIRHARAGRVLLGITGAGLVAFALYCLVEASHRVIPQRRPR